MAGQAAKKAEQRVKDFRWVRVCARRWAQNVRERRLPPGEARTCL
jgi:hypothetical protein